MINVRGKQLQTVEGPSKPKRVSRIDFFHLSGTHQFITKQIAQGSNGKIWVTICDTRGGRLVTPGGTPPP